MLFSHLGMKSLALVVVMAFEHNHLWWWMATLDQIREKG